MALADFIAPKESGRARTTSVRSSVTAGIGEDVVDRFKPANDDYSVHHGQALADRLCRGVSPSACTSASAGVWGYAADETSHAAN